MTVYMGTRTFQKEIQSRNQQSSDMCQRHIVEELYALKEVGSVWRGEGYDISTEKNLTFSTGNNAI